MTRHYQAFCERPKCGLDRERRARPPACLHLFCIVVSYAQGTILVEVQHRWRQRQACIAGQSSSPSPRAARGCARLRLPSVVRDEDDDELISVSSYPTARPKH